MQRIGRFEIKQLLGQGAMGSVYLAVDPGIGREVAIKTILPSAGQGRDAKLRFAQEAKAAGILNHPNLVTIYEFGEDQDLLYIAMEYIPGQDLEAFLQQQTLSHGEILEVLAQVCDGLAFAHGNGIVHRDIKPSNVRIIRDGKRLAAKITDFGVARISNSEMTATGMVMGTVSYMAPEYIRTGQPDPRSDLFAVGVMLYEALSGRKPFSGDTTPTILYRIVHEPPEPIDLGLLRDISPAVREVLDRSLVKDPDQRYQTAEDFARALRAAKDPTWSGAAVPGEPPQAATVQLPSARPPAMPTQMAPAGAYPAAPPPAGMPPAGMPQAGMPQAGMPPAGMPPHAAPPARPMPTQPPARSSSPLPILLGVAAGFVLLCVVGFGAWHFVRKARPEEPAAPLSTLPAAATSTPSNPTPTPPDSGRPEAGPQEAGRPDPGRPDPGRPDPGRPDQPPLGTRMPPLPPPGPAGGPKEPPPGRPPASNPPPEARAQAEDLPRDERFHPDALRALSGAERRNLALTTTSEAIALAESQPAKALEGLRNAIKADPGNANAYAWCVAILYEQGRYREIPMVMAAARRNGITRHQMMSNLRFRKFVDDEGFARRIPGGLDRD